MIPIAHVSWSPKSSSFCFKGVSSVSSDARWICSWILPISVRMPVAITTARHWPCVTAVPPKTTHSFACSSQSGSLTGSTILPTETDSPVSDAWSKRTVAVRSSTTRASAGTRSPVRISMTSPGTSSRAGKSCLHAPSRKHRAVSLCISLSASSAFSALLSCQTPTMALSTRMSRMTPGSTKSTSETSTPGARSSVNASANDTTAARSRILTSASSNCSSTSFHRGLPSSLSSSLKPCTARAADTCFAPSPRARSSPKAEATCSTSSVQGVDARFEDDFAARRGGMMVRVR